jgi:hypothetical protein
MVKQQDIERNKLGLITRITERILSVEDEVALAVYEQLQRKAAEAPTPEALITIRVGSGAVDLARVKESVMARLVNDVPLWDRTGWRRLTVDFREAHRLLAPDAPDVNSSRGRSTTSRHDDAWRQSSLSS